jgi:hypothetical protein
MKKLIIVIVFMALNSSYAQSLKIIYGDRLYYHNKDKFYEIKKREHAESFQGYDIVDSTHIFIAYDPEKSAEASTYLAVYDIKTKTEKFIYELGGTGESFFIYNKDNDLVLFNWYNGINIFKLHKENNAIIDKFEPKLIIECEECYLPFWVDSKTIGYQQFENGEWVTKYHNLEK